MKMQKQNNQILKEESMNIKITDKNLSFISFVLLSIVLFTSIKLGVMIFILSLFLSYQLVFSISNGLMTGGSDQTNTKIRKRSRALAGTIVGLAVASILFSIFAYIYYEFRDGSNVQVLLLKIGEIVSSTKEALPAFIADKIPQKHVLFVKIGDYIRIHASDLSSFGLTTIKGFGFCLIGLLIGCAAAISEGKETSNYGRVSSIFIHQINSFRNFFWLAANAQVKIAAINTFCTACYLYIILPIFGIDLPMRPAMLAVTFFCSIIPVLGNFVANTVVAIISLDYSFNIGVISVVYLITIHKFEYIWIGKIIGDKINCNWKEILIAIIALETCFGLYGVVIAPFYYAWLKSEWHTWDGTIPTTSVDTNA